MRNDDDEKQQEQFKEACSKLLEIITTISDPRDRKNAFRASIALLSFLTQFIRNPTPNPTSQGSIATSATIRCPHGCKVTVTIS